MVDPKQMGRLAGQVLENDAFRHVCETVQTDLRKKFLGDDDDAALEARREAKALETVLTKLDRLQERGRAIERQEKDKIARQEDPQAQVA